VTRAREPSDKADRPGPEPTAERHARIPYSFLDDPAFIEVYRTDALFATWVRLWMEADNAWPALALIPRSVDPEALDALSEAGWVLPVGSEFYRMDGMDQERMSRPGAAGGRARASVAARGQGQRFARGQDPARRTQPGGASALDPANFAQSKARHGTPVPLAVAPREEPPRPENGAAPPADDDSPPGRGAAWEALQRHGGHDPGAVA
jgi:hypothetical protein